MYEPITSPQNPKYKQALKLHTSRGRQKQNRIIVFGVREITRAISAGLSFVELFVDADGELAQIPTRIDALLNRQLTSQQTKLFSLTGQLFEKLSYGDRSSNLVGIADRPTTTLTNLRAQDRSLLVVLESIEKPGNLGAIARSADGSGAAGLLIADSLTDIFHPNAVRSSMGAVFSVPVACGASAEICQWLAKNGYSILVATPEAESSLYETDLTGRIAIVFGNEARGLSATWRSENLNGVRIPMQGIADSLNVSVTASLMMYEWRRQLGV